MSTVLKFEHAKSSPLEEGLFYVSNTQNLKKVTVIETVTVTSCFLKKKKNDKNVFLGY